MSEPMSNFEGHLLANFTGVASDFASFWYASSGKIQNALYGDLNAIGENQ